MVEEFLGYLRNVLFVFSFLPTPNQSLDTAEGRGPCQGQCFVRSISNCKRKELSQGGRVTERLFYLFILKSDVSAV